MSDNSNRFDLIEFALSKKIVEELPKVLIILEEFKTKLDNYRHFRDCDHLLHKIDDTIISTQLNLGVYQVIANRKGLIHEPK